MASINLNYRNDRANVLANSVNSGGSLEVYSNTNQILYSFNWANSIFTIDTNSATLNFNEPSNVFSEILTSGTVSKANLISINNTVVISNLSVGTANSAIIVDYADLTTEMISKWISGSFTEGNA